MKEKIKLVKHIPLLGTFLSRIYNKVRPNDFTTSKEYWEKRYKTGGTSGSGSYGRLAVYKSDFLNHFVNENNINSIVEFGCGDGNQLSLAAYPNYVGVDVSETAISMCQKKFSHHKNFFFYLYHSTEYSTKQFDLALSLDVIYHLIEDRVFEDYMKTLFNSSTKFVIIYAYDFDKKYYDRPSHEMGRNFTRWIEKNVKEDWSLKAIEKNPYPYQVNDPTNTSQSNFYIYQRCMS